MSLEDGSQRVETTKLLKKFYLHVISIRGGGFSCSRFKKTEMMEKKRMMVVFGGGIWVKRVAST